MRGNSSKNDLTVSESAEELDLDEGTCGLALYGFNEIEKIHKVTDHEICLTITSPVKQCLDLN